LNIEFIVAYIFTIEAIQLDRLNYLSRIQVNQPQYPITSQHEHHQIMKQPNFQNPSLIIIYYFSDDLLIKVIINHVDLKQLLDFFISWINIHLTLVNFNDILVIYDQYDLRLSILIVHNILYILNIHPLFQLYLLILIFIWLLKIELQNI